MPIEPRTVVKQSKHQVFCNLDDEVAILNLKSTLYFGLDEVGAYIWQALSEPRAVNELCKGVLDQFDVEETRCNSDVIKFLTELDHAGLIECLPSPQRQS
jgi:Coenzyme PQQ synthesis protein D (PqqD)